jgi:glucose/arabinose dehydrogenase
MGGLLALGWGLVALRPRQQEPADLQRRAAVGMAGDTKLPMSGGVFLPFVCQPAIGNLRFVDPVQVAPLPDRSGRLVVVERTGRLVLTDPRADSPTKTVMLDLADRLQLTPHQAEEGLLSIAFHPQCGQPSSPHAGEFYLYYTAKSQRGPTNRLSRFRMRPRKYDEVDPSSEEILLDQPDQKQAHNGGGLAFGPDGHLYLGVGDDAQPQPNSNAQTVSGGLFSGILRIAPTVRGPDEGTGGVPPGYYIPPDNPFVHIPGARGEFFAIGLRNPWRLSFDRLTGRLYVADPGDRRREEINVVSAGDNCGWAYAEGTLLTASFDPAAPAKPRKYLGRENWPIFEYPRDVAHRCVIGGHVYRGKQFPQLWGRYVYADQSGRIYALQLGADGRTVHSHELLAVVPDVVIGISSVDLDADGELLISTIGDLGSESGQVFRLRRIEHQERRLLPPTLAETNLFADWRELIPRPELVPYEVNVPLWSDGAEKRRGVLLPRGTTVAWDGGSRFRFPAGTVFVKHFELATDERQPDKRRPLETRVLVVDDRQQVYGVTYRWSADGNRTRPVTHAETEAIEITGADGTKRQQQWHYPGRFDCLLCHNASAGYVLGFVPKQLAGERGGVSPGGRTASGPDLTPHVPGPSIDELARLTSLGIIRQTSGPPHPKITPLVRSDDASAPLSERVRSYLDANCSMCHNPGTRLAAFDARIERPLEEQGLIDGHAYHHPEQGLEARIIKPDDLDKSVLYLRISSHEPHLRMPPLASTVVDENARRLIAEWIRLLPPSREMADRPPRSERE